MEVQVWTISMADQAKTTWKAATMMDANDELADEKSRLLLLQSLWAARMGGLE